MRDVLADWPRIKGSRMTEILRGHGYADSEELVKLRLHRHAPA